MTTAAATPPVETPPATPPATPPVTTPPPATPPAATTPPTPPAAEPARKDGEPPAPPKAPEKYTLTVPDGERITAEELTHFEAVARANGWTNEYAQQAITDHVAALDAQSARFLDETTADPDYGGAKLLETQQLAKAALEKLRPAGTPRGDALRGLLNRTGYGNHKEVISLLADIGKAMAEDTPIGRSLGSGAAPRDLATLLYGEAKA